MNIVSFSGGKDSTAMLLMMLEKGIQVDRVIFVDTTKEFPQMYEHIAKVQEMIKPIKIETVKIDFDYWFAEHIRTKGRWKGQKGYGWPDIHNRWCTGLKREAYNHVVFGVTHNPYKRKENVGNNSKKDIVEFIGIAYDEKHRTQHNKQHFKNRNVKYPLVEYGITEKQALEYCYKNGLDWGGLYEKLSRISCYCCPLQRINELRVLYNEFPELWAEMIEMGKKSHRKFRPDYSLKELTKRFEQENRQIKYSLVKDENG